MLKPAPVQGLSKTEMIKADGYPRYVDEASKLNIDVNDYLDNNMGWVKPLPILEKYVYPVIDKFPEGKILELGPGTGRWSRYILKKIKSLNYKEYILLDHSVWMLEFLKGYFKDENIIRFVRNNGMNIPDVGKDIDIVYAQGVLVALKPSFIYIYSKEFAAVLKSGGYCIFDYFNFDTKEGWDYFINESDKGNTVYTYHTDEFIDKIFSMAGFTLEQREAIGKSRFVVFKKN